MTRSLLAKCVLITATAALVSCTSERNVAWSSTNVADDGETLLVGVNRHRSKHVPGPYAHNVGVGPYTNDLWLVPIDRNGGRTPVFVRSMPAGNADPGELHGMLAAGYVYIRTEGEGRYLLDIASGEIRPISGPQEAPADRYLPSRDGRYLAHFTRATIYDCEDPFADCDITVEVLEASTLAQVSGTTFPLRGREATLPPPPAYRPFTARYAWTAAGKLRVTHGSQTVEVDLDGSFHDVPFEPCYYAATSSGMVSLAGMAFEQEVADEDGAFTTLEVSSMLNGAGEDSAGCVLPRE